jgi:CheY-like chemotaxis protein
MVTVQENKLHVMLADDDSDDFMLFNEALEHSALPLEFSWAEDGNKLLKLLDTGKIPDILFLDVNMPYKNGVECLNEIRSRPQFANLPIVIYSTTNYKVNIDACFKGGANLYIIKPNSFDEILKMVKKICNKEWTSTVSTPRPEFFIMNHFE